MMTEPGTAIAQDKAPHTAPDEAPDASAANDGPLAAAQSVADGHAHPPASGWLGRLEQSARRWQLAIATGVLATVLLPALGAAGLLDPWEMDRAAVARRMAGAVRAVVVEGPGDKLLNSLQKDIGNRTALVRAAAKADASALASLQQASQRLSREIAHVLVVDAAAIRQQLGGGWTELATQLAAVEAQNRGMVLVLATQADDSGLRIALAKARMAASAQANRNAATAGWLDGEGETDALWPLWVGGEYIVPAEQVATTLLLRAPSPWRWPVHKREGQNQALPWLDAAVTAAAMSMGGPTETGVRLGGALLVLLAGLAVVLGTRRVFGWHASWAALAVFATLPEVAGLGRLVTFEAGPMLGATLVALGLAQGALRSSGQTGRDWPLWIVVGGAILLAARGLGGACMAAGMAVAYVVAAADFRPAMLASVGGTLGIAALATWRVLGDGDLDPNWLHILRGWRFTQNAFSNGPDQYHRDFAWFVGQAGFGLYPWGAAVVLGLGRLLTADRKGAHDRDFAVGAALVLGLLVPFAVVAVLVRQFHHLALPVAGVAAVAAAALIADLLHGKVAGRLVGVFVALSTLLLHREIGKGADAVTRFFAFDPPIAAAGATGDPAWPTELVMSRGLRALALLAVLAFALGVARPLPTIRAVIARLQTRMAAGWALGVVGCIWACDALISLGTKLDVALKTQAQTTNYAYDRMWVVIQDTRPEVLAALTAFVLLVTLAVAASVWTVEQQAAKPWLRVVNRCAGLVGSAVYAQVALGVAALAVFGSGLAIFVHLQPEAGVAGALAAGLGSSAFATPIAMLIAAGLSLSVVARLSGTSSLLAPLVDGSKNHTVAVFSALGWLAVAGLGIGASQAAGTWSFPIYLIAVWALAVVQVLVVVAHARGRVAALAWPTVAAGFFALLVLFGPLAGRWVAEAASPAEGYRYLASVLFAAPDTALLWACAGAIAVNRWLAERPLWQGRLDLGLGWLGRIEQPRNAALALVAGGVFFAAGFAGKLLPDLAVHFSQKHLVQLIADAGGAGNDASGAPRTFTHGARTGNDNNFYTQSMPLIEDRSAVLALLANENASARVATGGGGGATRNLALAGWNPALDKQADQLRDHPAWFGLATSAEGTTVKVEGATWQAGQWRGAAVHAPNGQTATVVDNSASEITVSSPLQLATDDATRGWLTLDQTPKDANHPFKPELFAATKPVQRFVVLPKEAFSELNHAMRQSHAGQHIAVLDSSSSRLVLAVNFLRAAQTDANWLKKSLITTDDLAKLRGLRKILVNFDNTIHLVGYRLADHSVQRAQKYKMTLYWKVIKATPTSWKLFMHPHPLHLDRWPLTQPDPSEDDNKACNGCFATSHWQAGDLIADEFDQEVPLGTNSGPNEIILGWYNPSNDQRLSVISASGQGVVKHGDNRATIGHLQVR
ncbi:MAG: hypothetical protein EXR77_13585 [Myxococcales bacterium]|nr:hypothetical protein [Myxococcales bacterium]